MAEGPAANTRRPPGIASPVVPTTCDASANSAEQGKEKPHSQYDDPDCPQDRDVDQEADDEQNYTEYDHEKSLRQRVARPTAVRGRFGWSQ
jgi:hypothetical protein